MHPCMNGTSASGTGCVSLTICVFDTSCRIQSPPWKPSLSLGEAVRAVPTSWISSALLARAVSKIYHWHISKRTTKASPRWPFSVHRHEGLFWASLTLRAECRWGFLCRIQPGTTFPAHCIPETIVQISLRVKIHCGKTDIGMPREFGREGRGGTPKI